MDELISSLVGVIEKEVENFQRLLETLGREQSALVRHEIGELEAAIGDQQGLAEEAAALEQERIRITQQLSSSLKEDEGSLTMARLIDRLQEPQAECLREMRETLIDLQDKIQNANRRNGLLIKQSMKYVDKSIQILSGGDPSNRVYEQSGKIDNHARPVQGVVNQVI